MLISSIVTSLVTGCFRNTTLFLKTPLSGSPQVWQLFFHIWHPFLEGTLIGTHNNPNQKLHRGLGTSIFHLCDVSIPASRMVSITQQVFNKYLLNKYMYDHFLSVRDLVKSIMI